MEIEAEKEKQNLQEIKEYWAKVKEKERIMKEARDRIENEKKSFIELLKNAIRYHQAKVLKEYLFEIENIAKQRGDLDEQFITWLSWASKKLTGLTLQLN